MVSLSKLVKNIKSPSDFLRYSENSEEDEIFRPVVVFNITSMCNLSCEHCYYSAKSKIDPDELSVSEILNIADDLALIRVPVVLLSGGEPLMKKGIYEISKYISERGIKAGLSTNGTLINQSAVEKILNSGIDYVGISIDGPEQIHDSFRGKKGAFTLATKSLKKLISAGVRVSIRLTLSKINANHLEEILDWAESIGCHRFCIYHLVGSGRGKNIKDHALSPMQTRQILNMVYEKSKILNMEILTVDAPFDGFFVALKKLEEGDEEGARRVMKMLKIQAGDGTGKKLAVISHRGDVYLSQFWLDLPLGNVREEKFSHIWNNSRIEILQYLRYKVRDELEGRCGNCPLKYWCGGFRPRAFLSSGRLNGEDPLCYLEENEKMRLYGLLS